MTSNENKIQSFKLSENFELKIGSEYTLCFINKFNEEFPAVHIRWITYSEDNTGGKIEIKIFRILSYDYESGILVLTNTDSTTKFEFKKVSGIHWELTDICSRVYC